MAARPDLCIIRCGTFMQVEMLCSMRWDGYMARRVGTVLSMRFHLNLGEAY
jgi:hypothetical protein